jgi:hypothetical protein
MDCGTGESLDPDQGLTIVFTDPRLSLARALSTENAPPVKARRFWGYYREERYVSLYMWICGR